MRTSKTHSNRMVYLAELVEYFQSHAQHDPSFAPEHAAAFRILELMRRSPTVLSTGEQIRTLIHDVETADHYDGTGWFSFRRLVEGWLVDSGYPGLPEKRWPKWEIEMMKYSS